MNGRSARIAIVLLIGALSVAGLGGLGSAQADTPGPARRLQPAIEDLVAQPNGPPGALVLVQRGSAREVFRAGVANAETGAPMEPDKYLRIASTSKAYSGGVALSLVEQGVLSPGDTIREWLPWAPADWHRVTLRQLLHHTSGIPDYTESNGFGEYVPDHLADPVPPRRLLLRFVGHRDLRFDPGSRYAYSNSDNVAVGLIVQAATERPYERVLARQVRKPLGLDDTSLPSGTAIPRPMIHGYDFDAGNLVDVSEELAAGWAWASGGIVSTPADQNRFIRGYIGLDLFGSAVQRAQFAFRPGQSVPPGPGSNDAGLGVFAYRTNCGTMFGHTGNLPTGSTQFIAASRDGSRSVVVSVNRQTTPLHAPGVFRELRDVYRLAVCAALA